MKYIWRVVVFGIMLQAGESFVQAQDSSPEADQIKALLKRIEDLEQKVKALEESKKTDTNAPQKHLQELDKKVNALEHSRESDQKAAEQTAKETPVISAGDQGFMIASTKGDFKLQLKGLFQVDSRTFFNDSGIAGNDTLGIRRARPILQGTIFKDFEFLFVPDFAPSTPSIFDAYINYRYDPALQLQLGKMKVPVGLEMLQPDQYTLFNERSLATDLVPNRDVGVELHGDLWGGTISYALGIFNGVGDARNSSNVDFEDDKEFAGRVIFQPFKANHFAGLQGFGFGVAGSYESMQRINLTGLPATTGGILPGYTTDGQQQFFAYNPSNAVAFADGEHWRLSPQAFYFYGPFGFLAEYVISNQRVSRSPAPLTSAHLNNTAWEISGSWMLTGETFAYAGGVNPANPFDPLHGDWGAWQLLGRYAELDVDPAVFPLFSDPVTSAHAASSWSVGLNWYLNHNVCIKSSYSHTYFRGGGIGSASAPPGAVTAKDESVVFTRFQLNF